MVHLIFPTLPNPVLVLEQLLERSIGFLMPFLHPKNRLSSLSFKKPNKLLIYAITEVRVKNDKVPVFEEFLFMNQRFIDCLNRKDLGMRMVLPNSPII